MAAYIYTGYLGVPIAVNRESDGATVAVINPDGTIHLNYADHPLAKQWMLDTPHWTSVIAALDAPVEPETDVDN